MTTNHRIPLVTPAQAANGTRNQYLEDVGAILDTGRYRFADGAAREVEQLLGAQLGLPASWDVASLRSGTDALIRALRLLSVGAGQFVVVPDNAFHAVAASVMSVGAEPVFADVDPATWNLSPRSLEAIVESRPVHAVIAVDNYGTPAPLAALGEVVKPRGIPLVLDACESLGAERPNDSVAIADAIVMSFSFTKPLHGAGMGGALAASRELVARCWEDPVLLSSQFRMPELNAAYLVATWDHLGPNVDRLREIYNRYTQALQPLGFQPQRDNGKSTRLHAPFLVPPGMSSAGLVQVLAASGTEARAMFRSQSRVFGMGTPPPVAMVVDERVLCLPSGAGLPGRDLASVVDALRTTAGAASC